MSAFETGDIAAAEQADRCVLELDANNSEAIEHLAMVPKRLLRHADAQALLNRLARLQGLSRNGPSEPSEATILLLGGAGAGHVPTRYLFDPALFTLLSVTLLSSDQADAPLGGVPYEALAEADLVFNTLGEVDHDGGQAEPVDALAARLGKPILNPASHVARSGRDHVQALFGDILGLRVPAIDWMTRDALAASPGFAKTRLIRPGGSHGGKDLARVQSAADIVAYLAKIPHDRFLLSDFYDFKGERDCYHKYRIIFVDRQPFPYHLAISETWLVHYWRAGMASSEWKKREEEAFLTDWRQVFGPVAAAAVEQVGRRLDLDFGGLDCSLLPNGEVLFFEANACMLVHLDDAEAEFPYKHRAVPRMVRDRIARRAQGAVIPLDGAPNLSNWSVPPTV